MKAKRKPRARDAAAAGERAITAQPIHERTLRDQRVLPEEGLAVDAEDLATPFLNDATEQANFEGELPEDMAPTDPAPSDEALVGPDYDPDASLWEQTVRHVPAPASDIREITNAVVSDEERPDVDGMAEEENLEESLPVELHRDAVHEASLFDREVPDTEELRTPELDTDDSKE